jgi:predicted O-linked N-acetylglucosamine transferase (SPINDLY family)
MGADYIDYILADATIIPEDQDVFYGEQVVRLPDCYQVNDNRRRIANQTPSRAECGLPEAAFVFCCFNDAQKLTPEFFDIWMRLLRGTENSVIWLLEGNARVVVNLRGEAENRGVAPDRLIFAPRINLADHLARQRQADLFLDTLPCNAHTTASDALWAGLPVLTCLGETLAGRVAASLLGTVGLDELVTHSLRAYEDLALKLAHDPAYLASIKEKLKRNRDTSPLFDTASCTRHIETAYLTMADIWRRGERPRSFSVKTR